MEFCGSTQLWPQRPVRAVPASKAVSSHSTPKAPARALGGCLTPEARSRGGAFGESGKFFGKEDLLGPVSTFTIAFRALPAGSSLGGMGHGRSVPRRGRFVDG